MHATCDAMHNVLLISFGSGPGMRRVNRLAVVDDDGATPSPLLSTLLKSSVLVTGALLVGTGDCTVLGDSISVNASIQTAPIGMYNS